MTIEQRTVTGAAMQAADPHGIELVSRGLDVLRALRVVEPALGEIDWFLNPVDKTSNYSWRLNLSQLERVVRALDHLGEHEVDEPLTFDPDEHEVQVLREREIEREAPGMISGSKTLSDPGDSHVGNHWRVEIMGLPNSDTSVWPSVWAASVGLSDWLQAHRLGVVSTGNITITIEATGAKLTGGWQNTVVEGDDA